MSPTLTYTEPEPITIKSPATITGQIDKLLERGLIIDDEDMARDALETINYYRLVHYFAVFLDEKGEQYIPGTRFEDALRLYDFDKRLRAEILVALEEIEIAARAAVSNYHSVKYGAAGYLNSTSFDRRHNHRIFLRKVEQVIAKNGELSFVRHYQKKYGGVFPLWVLTEMFSFGMLAVFFQDLTLSDRKAISEHYFKQDHRNVESWLDCLATLRNRCAHYNRIYGSPLPAEPRKIEIEGGYQMGSSLFDYMLVVKFLHRRREKWGKSFAAVMQTLFDNYSDIADRQVLGFPKDWSTYF